MADVVLEARGITKIYRARETEVQALCGADIDLHVGEIAVVLGSSGSGKSTLVDILGGLDRPTSGNIRYKGRDLTRASDRELARYRREHVGFVFQFYNLIPGLTARENVAMVTEIARQSMDAGEALMLVGLEHCMDRYPSQMSGGEQQRVAIARAILKRPELLLCDEPTGALDGPSGTKVLDALACANRTLGITTAIVTRNAALQSMAHRVFTFGDGRIISVRLNEQPAKPSAIVW